MLFALCAPLTTGMQPAAVQRIRPAAKQRIGHVAQSRLRTPQPRMVRDLLSEYREEAALTSIAEKPVMFDDDGAKGGHQEGRCGKVVGVEKGR